MRDITESDWKKWKTLRLKCIDDFCHATFKQVSELSEEERPVHDLHRELYRLVADRDNEIERRFDPMKRSQAITQLIFLYRDGLITDADVEQFTEDLCNFLKDPKFA